MKDLRERCEKFCEFGELPTRIVPNLEAFAREIASQARLEALEELEAKVLELVSEVPSTISDERQLGISWAWWKVKEARESLALAAKGDERSPWATEANPDFNPFKPMTLRELDGEKK